MPRISVKFNDSTFAQIELAAERANLSPAFWVAQAISGVLTSSVEQSTGKSNPGAKAPYSSAEPKRRGRPLVEQTKAQWKAEEKILKRKDNGPKGDLCRGSRTLCPRDFSTSNDWCSFGKCQHCGVGSRHGILQPDGRVLIEDHGDQRTYQSPAVEEEYGVEADDSGEDDGA